MTPSTAALKKAPAAHEKKNTVQGWMCEGDLDRLAYLSANVPVGGIIVETGALLGQSSWTIAQSCDPSVTVFSMDMWDPTFSPHLMMRDFGVPLQQELFRKNTEDCANIIPLQGMAPQDFADWNLPIDLFFDDATHNDPPFRINQDFWSSHVRPGGIVCGHDFSSTFPDIVRYVEAKAETWDQKPHIQCLTWSLNKPSTEPHPRHVPSGCAHAYIQEWTHGRILDDQLLSCHIGSTENTMQSSIVVIAEPGTPLPVSIQESFNQTGVHRYPVVSPAMLKEWSTSPKQTPLSLLSHDNLCTQPLADCLDLIIIATHLSGKALSGLQRTLWPRLRPVIGSIYIHDAFSDKQKLALLTHESVHFWMRLQTANKEGNLLFNLDRAIPRALRRLSADRDLTPVQKHMFQTRFTSRLPKSR